MDGGGWQEYHEAQQEVEKLKKHNAALIYDRDKVAAEFDQVIGLLIECRLVINTLRVHGPESCKLHWESLIAAIDTHLPK